MRQNKRRLLFLGLLLTLLVVVAGCSREARYEVLTFFFTGVPAFDAPPEVEVVAGPVLSRREQLLAKRDQEAAAKVFSGPYVHGPYAANECEQCHEMAKGTGSGGSRDGKKTIVPGRFVLPPQELCVACHTTKSAASAQAAGLHLHGPGWNCIHCHNHHNGREPALLRVKVEQLCLQCHGGGNIHDAALHEGVENCLECHNPHMGRDPRMLREDFEETF